MRIEPTSFCKCTCFSNSTIIELRPLDPDKDLSDGLVKRTTNPRIDRSESWNWGFDESTISGIERREDFEDDNNDKQKKETTTYGRALTCNDCNRKFCLDYNLPKCKGAKEEDVIATCFRA